VVLIVMLAVAVLGIGVAISPILAPGRQNRQGLSSSSDLRFRQSGNTGTEKDLPDFGGGTMSFGNRSAEEIIDSAKKAYGDDSLAVQTYAGKGFGVAVRRVTGDTGHTAGDRGQASDSDYAVTLAFPARSESGATGLFELPSSAQFRKQLFPRTGDVEPPAPDIPLYPGSACVSQFGLGTATFIGFYLTAGSADSVRSFYGRTLGRLGWQRVPARSSGVLETFVKSNEDRTLLVQLRDDDSSRTRIGLVAMGPASQGSKERR
jgi:hypothetical protein